MFLDPAILIMQRSDLRASCPFKSRSFIPRQEGSGAASELKQLLLNVTAVSAESANAMAHRFSPLVETSIWLRILWATG